MKIFVKSKHDMIELVKENPDILNDSGCAFISICGLLDSNECDRWPFEKEGDNILKIVFDDITDREYEELTMFGGTECRLFNEDDAKTILDFVEHNENAKTLYVNCNAGISRSGAVGEAINYKYNDKDDSAYFYSENLQIIPNKYVRNVLIRMIDGDKDYSKIFHNLR